MRTKVGGGKTPKHFNVNVSFLPKDYEALLSLQKQLQAKTKFGRVSIASTIRAAVEAMTIELTQQTPEQ